MFLLKERPTAVQIAGVLTALLGSVLIIKPGFDGDPFSAVPGGLCERRGGGPAYTFVRKLGARG